jgi:hypothetical protein
MAKEKAQKCVCSCDFRSVVWAVVAALVMAVGIYLGVNTLKAQWDGQLGWWMGILLYGLTLLVFMAGKAMKWKVAEGCCMHQR